MTDAGRNVDNFNVIINHFNQYPNIIKSFRKFETIQRKLINSNCAILFNESCIKEGLLPKYSNIGNNDRATHTQTQRYRMDAVNNQLTLAKSRKLELSSQSELAHDEIVSINHDARDHCLTVLKQILDNYRQKEETKVLSKLNRLYRGSFLLPENLDQFVNLTDYILTETERELLNLGLNCHISSKFDKYIKEMELEVLYESLLKMEKDKKLLLLPSLRDQLRAEASKKRADGRSSLLTPQLRDAAQSLKNNNDIIIQRLREMIVTKSLSLSLSYKILK